MQCTHLSIIGRGSAKYHHLSVASRSIICQRQRQILIDQCVSHHSLAKLTKLIKTGWFDYYLLLFNKIEAISCQGRQAMGDSQLVLDRLSKLLFDFYPIYHKCLNKKKARKAHVQSNLCTTKEKCTFKPN